MDSIAVKQWCFYRYRTIWNSLKKYVEAEHRKGLEEIQALELRKEHLRKSGNFYGLACYNEWSSVF